MRTWVYIVFHAATPLRRTAARARIAVELRQCDAWDGITERGLRSGMKLSIVLLNWNGVALVEQCLRTIAQSGTRAAYEIVIMDNASTDGSQERLRALEREHANVRCVFNSANLGFGVGNNAALPFCQGRYVLFLNSDTLMQEPLDALVAAADGLGERCGALAGRVLNADRTLQLTARDKYTALTLIAGLTLSLHGIRLRAVRRQELEGWPHDTPRDVAMLSGCYLLVPQTVLARVGGFDPNIFLFFEDADLCYRIRAAGYVVRYEPVSTIVHLDGGQTRGSGLSERILGYGVWSTRYFARKYLGRGRARAVALAVWLWWLALWCILAPLSLVMPLPERRVNLRRRTRLLWHILTTMPRQRFP
jgi:GT2 family glycosyltransferase